MKGKVLALGLLLTAAPLFLGLGHRRRSGRGRSPSSNGSRICSFIAFSMHLLHLRAAIARNAVDRDAASNVSAMLF